MNAISVARNVATSALVIGGLILSATIFAADIGPKPGGRSSVYAWDPVATAKRNARVVKADFQVFGREGGIPLTQKLAAQPKSDIKVDANVLNRFGRA